MKIVGRIMTTETNRVLKKMKGSSGTKRMLHLRLYIFKKKVRQLSNWHAHQMKQRGCIDRFLFRKKYEQQHKEKLKPYLEEIYRIEKQLEALVGL